MQIELTNHTKKLCVIGDPIAHTKSPLIHNTMLRALGLDYIYMAQSVPKGAAKDWLQAAKLAGYAGFNATMPHKLDLVPLMDNLDEDAALYGAVNAVAIREGVAYGYNTDGKGFLQSLLEADIRPEGIRAVILGAGGAAKSAALKLVQQGARSVTVCNRTYQKAEDLCRLDAAGILRPASMDVHTLSELMEDADLLVNCTSLGMDGTDDQFQNLSFLDHLPTHAAAYDVIYAPAETLFLKQARLRGHKTLNGLNMLLWQAVFALEQFTDTTIDGQAMKEILKPVLAL